MQQPDDDVASWVCDHCGYEYWKFGMGPRPDGWRCLACRWVDRQCEVAYRLIEQALGKETD